MSTFGRGKVHNIIFFTNLFILEHCTSGRGENIFQYLELFNRYYGRWYIVIWTRDNLDVLKYFLFFVFKTLLFWEHNNSGRGNKVCQYLDVVKYII